MVHAAVGVLVVLAGCRPPMLMLHEEFMPSANKVIRTSIRTVGSATDKSQSDGQTMLNNYYAQVCDIEKGRATNCQVNLILENVLNYDIDTQHWRF